MVSAWLVYFWVPLLLLLTASAWPWLPRRGQPEPDLFETCEDAILLYTHPRWENCGVNSRSFYPKISWLRGGNQLTNNSPMLHCLFTMLAIGCRSL